jgi:hypothetical protein
MLRTLDHILNLPLILFPIFFTSKYDASPALMLSVKIGSAFEKYLRFSCAILRPQGSKLVWCVHYHWACKFGLYKTT